MKTVKNIIELNEIVKSPKLETENLKKQFDSKKFIKKKSSNTPKLKFLIKIKKNL